MTGPVGAPPDIALGAAGLLADFNAAGVLAAADVHVARTLGRLGAEDDERVLLAAALAVRAVRGGSVCIDLGTVQNEAFGEDVDVSGLAWPDAAGWWTACEGSPLVGDSNGEGAHPLRLAGGLLYLDRYWRQEQVVRTRLRRQAAAEALPYDEAALVAALVRAFPGTGAPDQQRLAAAAVVAGRLTVVAGGPGTGKTTTVDRVLDVLAAACGEQRVALAAPTGRAAARLQEAVGRPASTIHRLLGWRPGSRSRFRHDAEHRLPYDVVVVDETSMVSLTLMSRLLDAVRPDARLVLVGDPDQLASVEAGAVLGDLVERPARAAADGREEALLRLLPADVAPQPEVLRELRADVVRLRRPHRFGGAIAELAEAVRSGDAEAAVAVLRSGNSAVELVEDPADHEGLRLDAVDAGRAVHAAAVRGAPAPALGALARHRLLCGHRRGPFGVLRWGDRVQRWLAAEIAGYGSDGEWYRGRPLLVTANDPTLDLANGDAGVVIDDGAGGVVALFLGARGPAAWAPARLGAVETVHAMTVHKSQGSQFERVSVVLPPVESPLLTRELLYTAVTRASEHVRVIGSAAAVRAAVERPVRRASGLRRG